MAVPLPGHGGIYHQIMEKLVPLLEKVSGRLVCRVDPMVWLE